MRARRTEVGEPELRVLVLAPLGRDAELTCDMLAAEGIACHACAGIDELGRELAIGAGALVVTTEALGREGTGALERFLEAQEPWSDIPLVLATSAGDARAREASLAGLGRAAAVTILERPIRRVTLQTVLRAALQARRRQYEIRELLEELRVNVARLDAERVVRERFVSLLAHDLRGPLSAAVLAAKILIAKPASLDDRRNLASRIDRSLERIDRMVNDLLDANRIRAGTKLPLALAPTDLVEIANDVIADLEEHDQERVRLVAPERLQGVWSADQVRRALWNLVINAFKYGEADAPVDVELARRDDEVVVSVHNRGPPIPPDQQMHIFEPFGRAAGAEEHGRGWGLGLTLVRGCAEAHGGTLDFSSTAESGTTFTLRLPVDVGAAQKRGAPHGGGGPDSV